MKFILLDEVFIKLFCFEKFMLIKDEFRKKSLLNLKNKKIETFFDCLIVINSEGIFCKALLFGKDGSMNE